MNDGVKAEMLKVTLAGLLHDVGKLAERAKMEVSRRYLDDNAGLYQPYIREQNRHSHIHALFTAAFMERYAEWVPWMENGKSAKSGDSLINLAAMHHKPETPLQMIIREADHLSSGLDRQVFEGDEQGIAVRDYRKTRLIPIAEEMLRGPEFYQADNHGTYRYRYPLQELSPLQIFPGPKEEAESGNEDTAADEYAALFDRFVSAFKQIECRGITALWLENFDSMYQVFTSCVPAAAVGKVIPDVSLYDHSKATAALAAALYAYHDGTGSVTESAIRDRETPKFLLVSGDFYGIQNFIFTEGSSTNRAAAKLLRGRSFAVSLLSELAADLLCREVGLPCTSVLLNAAGKFTVLGPNLPATRDAIKRVEERVNSWLIERYFGEAAFGFAVVEAAGNDFDMREGRFARLWSALGRAGDARKYGKFDLERHGGVVAGYLDRFDNRFGACPFCGKRPGIADTREDQLLKRLLKDNEASCYTCRDHIHLGDRLVKSERLAVLRADADFAGSRLREPLFDAYQVTFDPTGDAVLSQAKQGRLLRLWHTGPIGERIPVGVAVRYISGYVPVYGREDEFDNRLLYGEKSEERKLELIDMISEGGAKSFHHIAKAALIPRPDSDEKYLGVEALGFLKADVDKLGKIFACGLPEERLNLSRLATFSRQMNSFFSLYLPRLFAVEPAYRDIYTVFAGGDDLFLVGPWNRMTRFAADLNRQFTRFVCGNPKITISAGISVNKPGIPVPSQSEHAEAALEAAKDNGRDSITLFGETVKWEDYLKMLEIRDTLECWMEKGYIGKAFLYRMNELIEMAQTEKNILSSGRPIEMDDMGCLKWRSLFTYSATRNVGKGLGKEERQTALEEVMAAACWLGEYAGKLRIALWQVLYNQR